MIVLVSVSALSKALSNH